MTNEPMGPNLLALPRIKSLIEEQGLKPTHPLLQKAMDGDAEAMYEVSCNYIYGENGFKKDCKEAYQWVRKAHQKGHVVATAGLGFILIYGSLSRMVDFRNTTEGMVLQDLAAYQSGSDWTACHLGFAYSYGKYGFPSNSTEAKRLRQKCLSNGCPHLQLGERERQLAHQMLEELVNRSE